MTRITKNIIIYSLVGALQFGLGAATLEAAPRHGGQPQHRTEQRVHQQSYRYAHHDRDRQHRIQAERERHERAMLRREHESEHVWRERQRIESEHHDNVMAEILGAAILFMILNN